MVDEALIDGALGVVIFDDDVLGGAFSVWRLLKFVPPHRTTKSALLWPMHWACHDRLFKGYPVTCRISTPNIARLRLSFLTCVIQTSFHGPLVARPATVVPSL